MHVNIVKWPLALINPHLIVAFKSTYQNSIAEVHPNEIIHRVTYALINLRWTLTEYAT